MTESFGVQTGTIQCVQMMKDDNENISLDNQSIQAAVAKWVFEENKVNCTKFKCFNIFCFIRL